MKSKLFFLSVTFISTLTLAQSKPQEITLIKKTVIGGTGSWDYVSVSSEDRKIYLSHGDQVEVLNVDTHQKIGVIKNTKGVHGICAIPSIGKGYITNGNTNNVTVFNTKTLKTIMVLPAGENPDALMYDAFSNRVFIFNNDSKNITVIDVKTDKIIKTIDIGGNPEAGVSNNEGTIFVNLEDTNEIVAFDSKTLAIKNRISLLPGEHPTGIIFDKKNQILYSACRKVPLMMIVDAKKGVVIAKVPIGNGVDGAVFDEKNRIAVSSNGEGTLTIVKEISQGQFVVLSTVKTEPGARTISIDQKTKHLFTVTAKFGNTPPASKENPSPRSAILPDTFILLEFGVK